jgi:hypothetical protein
VTRPALLGTAPAPHTAATNLRKEYGLEAAQVILGHKTLTVTQIYAEKNVEAAQRIMAEVG